MNSSQLAREIARQLELFTNVLEEDIEEVAEQVSKEAVQKLEQTSPEKTGDYAKGWRVKKKGSKHIVYNATDPQLTHLLEKGHVNRDGSRTGAKVHIKPVEERSNREFEEELLRRIQE